MTAKHDDQSAGTGGGGESPPERRTFLVRASSAAMGLGLVAAYGTFGGLAARFLYPAADAPRAWLFVADLASFAPGTSRVYVTPTGAPVVVARRGEGMAETDFIALSSTCPHLGCRVHWEAVHHRFFCPCHNGAFDAEGQSIAGPPKEAGQSLPRYPLRVEAGILYIEAPLA